jgi:hypothetical protein
VPATKGTTVYEGDTLAENAVGVALLRGEDSVAVYAVSSGDYHFIAT